MFNLCRWFLIYFGELRQAVDLSIEFQDGVCVGDSMFGSASEKTRPLIDKGASMLTLTYFMHPLKEIGDRNSDPNSISKTY